MKTNQELLNDYLDNNLNAEETTRVENILQNETQSAADLEFMKLAVDTVRTGVINEKVNSVRHSLTTHRPHIVKSEKAVVRSLFQTTMRIAAVFVVVLASAAIIKYLSVTDKSIYNRQFTGYELNNSRGQENADAQVNAYRNKNWNEVVALFHKQNLSGNKSLFLTAMAEMELKNFPQAVTYFEKILNTPGPDNAFQQESEYYLSLAYLMNHEEQKSIQLMSKMNSDTGHAYYPLASKLSPLDLKIIELKK